MRTFFIMSDQQTVVVAEDSVVMSSEPSTETTVSTEPKQRRPRQEKSAEKRAPRTKRVVSTNEMIDLKQWLIDLNLGVIPTVHVNGPLYTTCVLAVDFGTPLKGIKLTPEQSSELVTRLRGVTKIVMSKEVKVGVLTDHSAGIWWTTVS